MELENLEKITEWIQGACRGIRDFYGSRPPYLGLEYAMMSLTYLRNETGIKIKEIKSRILG